MTLLQRTNRISVPGTSTSTGSGVDEKVKVSSNDTAAQTLSEKLAYSATRPSVSGTILNAGNLEQLLLSSEAYVSSLLIVSNFGDNAMAQRGQVNKHYATLSAAVSAAQNNDSILVFGNQDITSQIIVANGRKISIWQMGGVWTSPFSSPGGIFNLSNNSSLEFYGSIDWSFTGDLIANVSTGAFLAINSFKSITAPQGLICQGANSRVLIQNGYSLSLTKVGSGACSFTAQNGGALFLSNINRLSTTSPFLFCGLSSGLTQLNNVTQIEIGNNRLYNSNVGSNNNLKISNCTVSGGVSTATFGIIYTQGESNIELNNVAIKANSGRVISMIGQLCLEGCNLSTGSNNLVVSYQQLNATENKIVNSKLVSNGATSNLNFIGQASSSKLILDDVRSNAGLPFDTQIIEGVNFIDADIS